ncbi:MAG: hypothetical protein LBQ73_00030 [Tannerellaceae bacterium]|jgi:glucosylceramidase|nr:hypothetical protein [Tannerellaceae bacterium]
MKNVLILSLALWTLLMLAQCRFAHSPARIEMWLTKGDESVKLQPIDKMYEEEMLTGMENTIPVVIHLDDTLRYQKMIGFGGAICDNSAYVFDHYLKEEDKIPLFKQLFGEEGIRLNYMRMIMGSTDNSFDWYTYDDMPEGMTDEKMEHFTMAKDEWDVIPYYQLARKINPDLMILGSPCSPPAWMKNSKHLFNGSVEPQYYSALAAYFVKYVQTMETRYNLPVEAITIQNEPLYERYVPNPRYPNMLMTDKEQGEFIKTALGPAFERESINTKIITFDHNWDLYAYALTLLKDPEVKKYIGGTGFHCYGGLPSLMENIWKAHPDKPIYHTECSGGGWGASDFPGIMEWLVGDILIGNIENFTSTVLLWYMATDENAGPITNGCSSCRPFVTIQAQTGEITFNPEYYLTGHFSKFIDRGAWRIHSSHTETADGIRHIAFLNPDGTKVVVVLNPSETDRIIEIQDKVESFRSVLPAKSTATYRWND